MAKNVVWCFLLSSLLLSCSKSKTQEQIPPVIDSSKFVFAKGADVSWITEMESSGRKFYDSTNTQKEILTILKGVGMNVVRLRVWVNPAGGWNNKADVLAKAVRAKNLGLRIMIDFHYSDTWADPGNQTKPALWVGKNLPELKLVLSAHTIDVLSALKSAGISPEWVQVGNETNNGMLWPDGKASNNMNAFAQLINAGYDAVKSVFPSSKVIVHISNGWDNGLFRWIFDGLKNNSGKWDVIGLSLYPTPSNWTTINAQALANMNDMVTRFGKEVMVVEIGMSWDSPTECLSFLNDIILKTKSIPGNKGLGVLYWEPEAYNNWNGYTLGAFDNSGKPTKALNAFK